MQNNEIFLYCHKFTKWAYDVGDLIELKNGLQLLIKECLKGYKDSSGYSNAGYTVITIKETKDNKGYLKIGKTYLEQGVKIGTMNIETAKIIYNDNQYK